MIINGIDSTTFGSATLGVAGNPKKLLAFYDPRDTNHDGNVSVAETFQYSLTHPVVDIFKALPPVKTVTPPATQSPASVPVKAGTGTYDSQGRIADTGQAAAALVPAATVTPAAGAAATQLFAPLSPATPLTPVTYPYDSQGQSTPLSQGNRLDVIA